MSLFLRIFLWFWLATALIVGAVMLVNWSTSSVPLARQYRNFVREAVTNHALTAAQIYKNQGLEGVEEHLKRLEQRRRISSVAFYDQNRKLIYGKSYENAGQLFEKMTANENPQFLREVKATLVGISIVDKDGDRFYFMLERSRFQRPPFFTPRLLFQILAVVLIGGFVCYALARYLTGPIKKLRGATQLLAEGNFETRIADQIGNRGDEVALLGRDFDEMAKRIQILITSEKRLTQDISHELRSPLARMNVAIELARAKAAPDQLPLLGRLESESEKLNDLVSQLLTLSKLEAGAVEFEKTRTNLTKIVSTIVEDTDFEAKPIGRGARLISSEDVRINGNEMLISSAIENVVRNAVRYTPKGTNAEISLTTEGSNAKLEIRDFGKGVSPEELSKLFRPFYRASEARDRKSGGVGLGLAIAERAVDSHGGEIFAKNTEEGLLVTILLPLN